VTMNDASPIRVVCFDLGGVIVRHCRSWEEGLRAAGIRERGGPVTVEQRAAQVRHGIALVCGLIGAEEFARGVSDAFDGAYTPDEVRRVHEAWVGAEYDGVHRVVSRLLDGGRVETGALSNIDEVHMGRVEGDGAARWATPALLRHRVMSCRVGLAKPMPGIYERFETASRRRGGEILFFDDMEENVLAARSRGWAAHRVDWQQETAPQIERTLRERGLI